MMYTDRQLRIALAPAFDKLTLRMADWLHSMQGRDEGTVRLLGEEASTAVLRKVLGEAHGRGIVVIFYGHGDQYSFLTARNLGFEQIDEERSRLCTADEFGDAGIVMIVAYCCLSALGFGAEIRAKGPENRFLGYTAELPFMLGYPEEEAFRKPLEEAVGVVLRSGEIDSSTIRRILAGYREAHREWSVGQHAGEDRSLLVQMFLEEHARVLDRKVGGT